MEDVSVRVAIGFATAMVCETLERAIEGVDVNERMLDYFTTGGSGRGITAEENDLLCGAGTDLMFACVSGFNIDRKEANAIAADCLRARIAGCESLFLPG